jgi:thiamine biosynthesis protein ThiI
MIMSLYLVRYGELGLKSPKVRMRFERALLRNIEDAFLLAESQCLTDSDWGRIYLHADDDAIAANILKKIFGITSYSKAVECSSELKDICQTASEYSRLVLTENSSFAVRATRSGKHQFTSHDVAREVGSCVIEANKEKNITVNLTKPDHKIFVEVRHNRAFVYNEKLQGPGGFPMGSQGKVLAQISDKKSIYAAWLLAKRGCNVRLFCIDEKSLEYASVLRKWYLLFKPLSPEKDGMENIVSSAKKIKAEALVFGYTFDEFKKENKVITEIPIFYPLIGMKEKDIEEKLTSLFGCDF